MLSKPKPSATNRCLKIIDNPVNAFRQTHTPENELRQIMSKTSFKDLINSEIPVLIDFYADWCGPCKALAPVIQQVKSSLGDKVRIVKIDVDQNPQISQKLQIRSIPTLMIFQQGEVKWRAMGVQSLQTIRNELEKLQPV